MLKELGEVVSAGRRRGLRPDWAFMEGVLGLVADSRMEAGCPQAVAALTAGLIGESSARCPFLQTISKLRSDQTDASWLTVEQAGRWADLLWPSVEGGDFEAELSFLHSLALLRVSPLGPNVNRHLVG